MTHFPSDDPLKSEISYFQIFIFIDFHSLATKFGLALEPTVLRLEDLSTGCPTKNAPLSFLQIVIFLIVQDRNGGHF